MRSLSKADELVTCVLQDGPISIEVNRTFSAQFEGYWDSDYRTIHVSKEQHSSNGALLCTILFELHNASRNSDFNELYQRAATGQIDKRSYVRQMEYLEYQNARATSLLLNEGIEQGLFPESAYWPIADDFEEHLSYQKASGHSDWLGGSYDYWAQSSAG